MAVDKYSKVFPTPAFAALVGATGSATGVITGTVIDTSAYRSNTLFLGGGLQSASVTGVTPVIMEGAVTGTLTSVANANLIGTEAAVASGLAGALTTPGAVEKIAYIGNARYISVNVTVAGAATGVYYGVWMQSDKIKEA